MNIENVVLAHLVLDDKYGKKVFPFIKEEYFSDRAECLIFRLISEYVGKYNSFPSKEALAIEISNLDGLGDDLYKETVGVVSGLELTKEKKLDWLIDQTEKFCQDRAVYNALRESIKIADDKTGKLEKGAIPKILVDALSVSFDSHVGHDYIEDWEARLARYQEEKRHIPFDLHYLNLITNGGLIKKSLNVVMGGTGTGKSHFMCHCAAHHLSAGLNVLYISMEMSEESLAERIDANLLDVSIRDFKTINKSVYADKIKKLKASTIGKLIIKEYPSGTANASNFRYLINDLKLKKNFKPDIIYVDYLNICSSARLKRANANSYEYVKSISEEIRALASEFDVPIISATQTNRSGFGNSDVDMTGISESFGLGMTVDILFAIIRSEELDDLGQVMIKQIKNRYAPEDRFRRFVIGVDREKMRFYDVEQDAQTLNGQEEDDKPTFDKGKFSTEEKERNKRGPNWAKLKELR